MNQDSDLFAEASGEVSSGSVVETTVVGAVTRVQYRSESGDYAVVRVKDHHDQEWVLVGPLGELAEGQEVEATGRRQVHAEYGPQIRVRTFQAVLPNSEAGIRRYLGSGIVPGIGPTLADRIVDHFGVETLRVMETASARLLEIPGLGKSRLQTIRDAWREHAERRGIYVFLQGLGVSPAYCDRIYRRYGQEAATVVTSNPYQLAREVKGIGFKMSDGVARHLNIADDNPFRLTAGAEYLLEQLTEQGGHTCLPKEALVVRAAEALEVDEAVAEQGIAGMVADGRAVLVEDGCAETMVQSRRLFAAESNVHACLQARLARPIPPIPTEQVPRSVLWQKLNEAQRAAVTAAFRHPVSIITGGPGVGKTTVTREIVTMARLMELKVALAAPTGRAAKRLSESCKAAAKTIHRLLKWDPQNHEFVHHRGRPLACDVLIVDEVSMLDIELAARLLEALPPAGRLVLVGDSDQLPSVGPGSFLRDVIASGRVAVTHLSEVYRQAGNSRIIRNAHRVNRGEMPNLERVSAEEELRDFYWIEQDDPGRTVEIIERLVTERIPERFELSPQRDVQVLAPMNRGTCGTVNLNQRLQAALNPSDPSRAWQELRCGDTGFRVNDRVMQISNNYDLQVFNGDLGRIARIDNRNKRFVVDYDMGAVEYGHDDAHQLRLAYAITIHKSQGCEFPAVVVPILTQHFVMLQRNLIYTAMTRAKRLLILVGSARALAMAVKNVNNTPRYSRLKTLLCHD